MSTCEALPCICRSFRRRRPFVSITCEASTPACGWTACPPHRAFGFRDQNYPFKCSSSSECSAITDGE
eukprot:17545-Amphidinium_carterae.1